MEDCETEPKAQPSEENPPTLPGWDSGLTWGEARALWMVEDSLKCYRPGLARRKLPSRVSTASPGLPGNSQVGSAKFTEGFCHWVLCPMCHQQPCTTGARDKITLEPGKGARLPLVSLPSPLLTDTEVKLSGKQKIFIGYSSHITKQGIERESGAEKQQIGDQH